MVQSSNNSPPIIKQGLTHQYLIQIPFISEDGLVLRDIGNPKQSVRALEVIPRVSLVNNNIFNTSNEWLDKYCFYLSIYQHYRNIWCYSYINSGRQFKIHKSLHPYLFFLVSVYLPYRFQAQINSAILVRVLSHSAFINSLFKGIVYKCIGNIAVYSVFIFTGQLLARWYWTYKRSYAATKTATYNSYQRYITSRNQEKIVNERKFCSKYGNPYLEDCGHYNIRPNLAS